MDIEKDRVYSELDKMKLDLAEKFQKYSFLQSSLIVLNIRSASNENMWVYTTALYAIHSYGYT